MKTAEQSETIRVIRRHSIKPKKGQIDSTWLLFPLLALLPFLFAGCSTGNGGGGSQGNYRGPDEWRDPILAEIHRQDEYTGGAPGEASQVSVNVYRCGSPSGETRDGPYACDPACTHVDGCVHAWNLSRPGSWGTEFLFVAKPGDMPPHPIIRHEVGHFIFRDSTEQANHPTGHPDKVTVRGKIYRVTDVIAGARWPARVWNAVTFGVFEDDPWAGIDCTRTKGRYVTTRTEDAK